jgi:hypothetical protein
MTIALTNRFDLPLQKLPNTFRHLFARRSMSIWSAAEKHFAAIRGSHALLSVSN